MEAELEAQEDEEEEDDTLPGHPELDLKAKFSPQIFGFRRRTASSEDEENLLTPEEEEEGEEEEDVKPRKSRTLGLRSFVSELRRGLEDDDEDEEGEEPAPEEEEESPEETISDAFSGTPLGDEPSTFAEAKAAKALASQKNPSAKEDPMDLGDIGLP